MAISCDMSILLPSISFAPTVVPGDVQTIVADTAAAAYTKTAAFTTPSATPTWTPLPTHTRTITPSPTATFLWLMRTPTPRASSKTPTPKGGGSSENFACDQVSQNPADGAHYDPKQNFKVTWKLRNTGVKTWNAEDVDFEYLSGTKMYKSAIYDLTADIAHNETVNFVVAEVAPKNHGTYKTVWSLMRGNNDFCHVDLTIVVP